MNVSIIIVNYNTKDLLRDCLASIYEHAGEIAFEVIVSDNGSTDGSIEMIRAEFPRVIVIENNANLGFGAANNRGLDVASGKYVFYFNSDTVLLNNAAKIFYDFWDAHPAPETLGALGCNLVDGENRLTHSYGPFPALGAAIRDAARNCVYLAIKTLFYIVRYDYRRLRHAPCYCERYGAVDYITGADLFVRNDENARFDERFFLYYEETDLEYRLVRAGLARLLIQGPMIRHTAGGSNAGGGEDFTRYRTFSVIQMYLSRVLYFRKNMPERKFSLGMLKLLTALMLCNPFFIGKTYKYLRQDNAGVRERRA
jgi:GT2 family glycosyltransferase